MKQEQQGKKPTETLKPEQMESGKWYVVKIAGYEWLLKFESYKSDFGPRTFSTKRFCLDDGFDWTNKGNYMGGDIESIRPATKEEVLKYFPDEKFVNVSLINEVNNSQVTEQQNQIESEKVELRPEELVSGEVYTTDDCHGRKWTFSFDRKENSHLHYFKMLFQKGMDRYSNSWLLHVESDKLYHATPEEKALLLGEEKKPIEVKLKITEWDLRDAKNQAAEWKAKFEELKDKYTKLESYNDELTEKINQTENQNNREKVYFCNTHKGYQIGGLEWAIKNSREQESIYEAVCIGKKKSVLEKD